MCRRLRQLVLGIPAQACKEGFQSRQFIDAWRRWDSHHIGKTQLYWRVAGYQRGCRICLRQIYQRSLDWWKALPLLHLWLQYGCVITWCLPCKRSWQFGKDVRRSCLLWDAMGLQYWTWKVLWCIWRVAFVCCCLESLQGDEENIASPAQLIPF